MRRNNGFMSFFVFLVFLTYVFYLSYGFMKKRKENTNKVISSINIRKEDFYKKPKPGNKNVIEEPVTPSVPKEEVPAVQPETAAETEVPKETAAETPEEKAKKKKEEEDKQKAAEKAKIDQKAKEDKAKADKAAADKTKSYVRVVTLDDKAKADEVLKKLGGNFKIRTVKKNDGTESYIIVSKTVESDEELKKIESQAKSYSYQVIKLK